MINPCKYKHYPSIEYDDCGNPVGFSDCPVPCNPCRSSIEDCNGDVILTKDVRYTGQDICCLGDVIHPIIQEFLCQVENDQFQTLDQIIDRFNSISCYILSKDFIKRIIGLLGSDLCDAICECNAPSPLPEPTLSSIIPRPYIFEDLSDNHPFNPLIQSESSIRLNTRGLNLTNPPYSTHNPPITQLNRQFDIYISDDVPGSLNFTYVKSYNDVVYSKGNTTPDVATVTNILIPGYDLTTKTRSVLVTASFVFPQSNIYNGYLKRNSHNFLNYQEMDYKLNADPTTPDGYRMFGSFVFLSPSVNTSI